MTNNRQHAWPAVELLQTHHNTRKGLLIYYLFFGLDQNAWSHLQVYLSISVRNHIAQKAVSKVGHTQGFHPAEQGFPSKAIFLNHYFKVPVIAWLGLGTQMTRLFRKLSCFGLEIHPFTMFKHMLWRAFWEKGLLANYCHGLLYMWRYNFNMRDKNMY